MLDDQPLTVTLDGRMISLGLNSTEPLVRAVVISLFTWRRAKPADELPGTERCGWWGDSFATVADDRIGSRLWLLARAKITPHTVTKAKEYAQEALAWLVADGVASEVTVEAERAGLSQISMRCQIVRLDAPNLDIRFNDAWSFLNV